MATTNLPKAALSLMHEVYKSLGNDERVAYTTLMMSAVMSGHMIEQTKEEMHKLLDDVHDLSLQVVTRHTETKQ